VRQSNQFRFLYRNCLFIKPAASDLSDQFGETNLRMRFSKNVNSVARGSFYCSNSVDL